MNRLTASIVALLVFLGLSSLKPGQAQTPPIPADLSVLQWRQPYGLRNQVIPLTVRLINTNAPVVGFQVRFWDRSDAYGPRYLGAATTDSNGYARLSYAIPGSPLADNVIVTAKFDPSWTYPGGSFYSNAESSIRVQIGRSYP